MYQQLHNWTPHHLILTPPSQNRNLRISTFIHVQYTIIYTWWVFPSLHHSPKSKLSAQLQYPLFRVQHLLNTFMLSKCCIGCTIKSMIQSTCWSFFPFIYRILSPDDVLPRDTCHMTIDGILRSHLRLKITVYNILSVMRAAPFSVKIVLTNTMKSVSSVQILTQ